MMRCTCTGLQHHVSISWDEFNLGYDRLFAAHIGSHVGMIHVVGGIRRSAARTRISDCNGIISVRHSKALNTYIPSDIPETTFSKTLGVCRADVMQERRLGPRPRARLCEPHQQHCAAQQRKRLADTWGTVQLRTCMNMVSNCCSQVHRSVDHQCIHRL